VLTEVAARWLLVLHTAIGVAAVGAATHLAIWMRRYVRGQFGLRRAVQKFAVISLVLHGAGMIAGNIMYPTYKVEVRAAYLENAGAIIADHSAREAELERLARRERQPPPEPEPTAALVKRASQAARWFDVKEHWIALGLFASLGLVLVVAFWDPRRDGKMFAPIAYGLSLVIAGTLWLGAIIGVLTSAWRAV
jgi:hypothetical protein